MILIADSGATKTEWRIVRSKEDIAQAFTEGISPQYENESQIAGKIAAAVEKKILPPKADEIFFYGTGCASAEKKETVKRSLSQFGAKTVEVHTDFFAVARALCGSTPGIASILGTGSSSCYYDGREMEVKVPSLGYLLGDEGSGAHLGKLFLAEVLKNKLPKPIITAFYQEFPVDLDQILHSLRTETYPSRYLASYAPFIHRYKNDPQVYKIISDSFSAFCNDYILPYPEHKTCAAHFCGSVAFHFSDILHRVCKEKNIKVGNIAQSPVAGLTLYHLGTN